MEWNELVATKVEALKLQQKEDRELTDELFCVLARQNFKVTDGYEVSKEDKNVIVCLFYGELFRFHVKCGKICIEYDFNKRANLDDSASALDWMAELMARAYVGDLG